MEIDIKLFLDLAASAMNHCSSVAKCMSDMGRQVPCDRCIDVELGLRVAAKPRRCDGCGSAVGGHCFVGAFAKWCLCLDCHAIAFPSKTKGA